MSTCSKSPYSTDPRDVPVTKQHVLSEADFPAVRVTAGCGRRRPGVSWTIWPYRGYTCRAQHLHSFHLISATYAGSTLALTGTCRGTMDDAIQMLERRIDQEEAL